MINFHVKKPMTHDAKTVATNARSRKPERCIIANVVAMIGWIVILK